MSQDFLLVIIQIPGWTTVVRFPTGARLLPSSQFSDWLWCLHSLLSKIWSFPLTSI